MSESTIDTSTQAVAIAARILLDFCPDVAAERASEIMEALAAERDAAVARASEHGAYRTAASAFLASKGLLGEFDAWCEARGRSEAVAAALGAALPTSGILDHSEG